MKSKAFTAGDWLSAISQEANPEASVVDASTRGRIRTGIIPGQGALARNKLHFERKLDLVNTWTLID